MPVFDVYVPLPFLSKRTLTRRFTPFPVTRGDSRRESKTEFEETQEEERKKKEAASSKGPIVFQESSEARLSADSIFYF